MMSLDALICSLGDRILYVLKSEITKKVTETAATGSTTHFSMFHHGKKKMIKLSTPQMDAV